MGLTKAGLAGTVEKKVVQLLAFKELATMIPNSRVFDQQTLTLMQEYDPIVQRYRCFLALSVLWESLSRIQGNGVSGTTGTSTNTTININFADVKDDMVKDFAIVVNAGV